MESHLLQMRGLKLSQGHQGTGANRVASFTDAWIETLRYLACGEYGSVASFTDAWIETEAEAKSILVTMCRIFYRCVD